MCVGVRRESTFWALRVENIVGYQIFIALQKSFATGFPSPQVDKPIQLQANGQKALEAGKSRNPEEEGMK